MFALNLKTPLMNFDEGLGVLGFQFERKRIFDFTKNSSQIEKCRKSE